jgi:hypothetical protein
VRYCSLHASFSIEKYSIKSISYARNKKRLRRILHDGASEIVRNARFFRRRFHSYGIESRAQMSEKYAGNALQIGDCLKNQQNQQLGRNGRRELPSYGWHRSESTMQLARFFRD